MSLSHCVSATESLQERIPPMKPDGHYDPIGNYGTVWVRLECVPAGDVGEILRFGNGAGPG
ncbi:MAG TPA: hypothetical protein PLQ35_16845 [bacterium]|nr:hypothetical protein [bacterium]HQL63947.1 hypothetical protein [bacterium]